MRTEDAACTATTEHPREGEPFYGHDALRCEREKDHRGPHAAVYRRSGGEWAAWTWRLTTPDARCKTVP